ncbi:hypothetical protein EJV47_02955 [Hymenobacter gummosus]|uniref:Uncharacterized protein n=1 Tax=Hymenobacter gummosus TaxID=1776032 RepID=A0A431U9E6_9BACT|nr:hypothetical protein [Hymenobacter gummosus]RTQ53710.1 hypothetical protein EJV47_02955 [Hymenobacter gummosus]
MGALLTSTCLRTGLLLLVAAGPGCRHCREETVTPNLAPPYDGWFRGRAGSANPTVAATTAAGLTDSYPNTTTVGGTYPDPLSYNCTQYHSESRNLNYAAALYGYSFRISVVQYHEGPLLLVSDYSRGNPATTWLRYHLSTGKAEPIRYSNMPAGVVPDSLKPDVRQLPSLTVNGYTYAPVWRLTNPYLASRGAPSSAAVLYLSPEYGLVRFEQRDGTVWNLEGR